MALHLDGFRPLQQLSKLFVFLIVLLAGPPRAGAQAVRDSMWVTNGTVDAIATSGSTVYIGGDFTYVGPPTGGAVAIDAATGAAFEPFTHIPGDVRDVEPDGNGGWFIAGGFTSVQGKARKGLAHLDATGKLTSWDPNLVGCCVNAMAVSGGTVFVGGGFTSVGGEPRVNLAAIDATTGLATGWNPGVDSYVMDLAVSGGLVYVAGAFHTIGGAARNHLAAVDETFGFVTGWNPNPNNSNVFSIAVSGNTVYAGGLFTSIGGQPRSLVAAIDASTGLATSWNPGVTGFGSQVHEVEVSGNRVYVGGSFNTVGGQPRSHLASIDATTGAVTSWSPNPNNMVLDVTVSNNTVYAGGFFTSISSNSRSGLAAFNATTGALSPWNPKPDGRGVFGLAVQGSVVYAVGNFYSVGGVDRNRIAALDAATGIAPAWNPNANDPVLCLAVDGGKVYAGGLFTTMGGQPRGRLAAIDSATGAVTSWNPNATGPIVPLVEVSSLVVSGSTVYAGGTFTIIGGQMRTNLAALNSVTGSATSWNPGAVGGRVGAMAMSGNTVYVGGSFFEVGGQPRNFLAAINATTGTTTGWNPNPDNFISAIMTRKDRVFVGGDFTTIGGQSRNRVAAVDSASAAVTAWNPSATGTVKALASSGGKVYVGGEFQSVGGQNRWGLAVVIDTMGTVRQWDAQFDFGDVRALVVKAGVVHVGGFFGSARQRVRAHYGAFTEAALAITDENLGRGFVATDFMVGSQNPGPMSGVAYLPNQNVLVSGSSGRLYRLPNHDDNQEPPSPIQNYGMPAGGMAQLEFGGAWHYYMALGDNVVEVDPATGGTQPIVNIPGARWLTPFPPAVASPLHGHLFVTGHAGIWIVDPATGAHSLFAGTGYAEGIAFSPNGDVLYAALPGQDVVRAFTVPGGIPIWDSPSHMDPYTSISVGLGNLAGYIYVTTTMGNIWEFGLPGGPHAGVDNLLATGGTSLFSSSLDPFVPCPGGYPSLLVTAVDHIARIDPPGGGWFGGPTSSADPFGGTTDVSNPRLTTLSLAAPRPNPALGRASLAYSLPIESEVELSIFGVDGRRVRTLTQGRMPAGQHVAAWDGRDESGQPVASGVFYVVLRAGREKATRSLVLLR